jgi:hypothetical protein
MKDEERKRVAGTKSVRVRHFAERMDPKRGLLRFSCEAQPLVILTIYDLPKRCPLCSQNHPIPIVKGEPNAD